MPTDGKINTVFSLDDRYVLRVPRNHPAHVEQAFAEAQAIPLAVDAGVRTPRLIGIDSSLDLVPVPILIVELVNGTDLESARSDPAALDDIWLELGRDLGRLHSVVRPDAWPGFAAPSATLVSEVATEPRELLEKRTEDGWFSYVEAAWLSNWLERLGPIEPAAVAATHGDIQMSNVLSHGGRYAALIDWGCSACKDPVVDFMPLPFTAVPALLRGHREVAPLPDDQNAEHRILLGRLHTLLAVLPRGATPRMTWGERPTAWLTDLLRFFQHPPGDVWRALAPPSP